MQYLTLSFDSAKAAMDFDITLRAYGIDNGCDYTWDKKSEYQPMTQMSESFSGIISTTYIATFTDPEKHILAKLAI